MDYQKTLRAILPSNQVSELHVVYWLFNKEHHHPATEGYVGVTSVRRFEKRMKEHKSDKQFENIKILLKECAELCYTYEYVLRPEPHIGWNKATGGAKGRELNHSHSIETKRKIGLGNAGNKRPDLVARNKLGWKQKIIICPHCGKSGGNANMKRYHFDNCTSITKIKRTYEEIYGKEKSLKIRKKLSKNN